MKVSRIAMLAALGMVAMTLPAAAAPSTSDSSGVRTSDPATIQLAQNATRAANEARGGDYKAKKKKKKKKKKM